VSPPADLTEDVEKRLAVLVVQVKRRAALATRGDMIYRAG
jgi:hypothetical protein